MENLMKKFYGAYEMPEEIMKLHKLEEELNAADSSLDRIGFLPCTPDFSYTITPPDLIPFAHTGGGGIHFGFLTDFGQVPTLTEAPIVCVSPTNDPPIRYMADNMTDFFNLVASVPHAEMLENFWDYTNEQAIQEEINMMKEDTPADWAEEERNVKQLFNETFQTKPIHFVQAIQNARTKREQAITIPTMDGLGIVAGANQNPNGAFEFSQDSLNANGIEKIKTYLNSCSRAEKLAFIRDANYRFILSPSYDKEILQIVIDLLQKMDLNDEAERMRHKE